MKGSWSIISLIGAGVIITLIFYFSFTLLGIYGKAGKPEGMVLNIIGAIIFIIGILFGWKIVKSSKKVKV